jgi:hypothetical protein
MLLYPMKSILSGFSILMLLVIIAATGCKKDDIIIDDNTAPPDSTISTLTLENYVAKCYISLLGRDPSNTEEADAVALLRASNMSVDSRNEMIDEILSYSEYRDKILEFNSIKLLNSAFDTTEIQTQIFIYNSLLNDPQYAQFYDLIIEVIDNLETLLATPNDFRNGTIGMQEMHRRLVSNEIYDQINMGSFNFVLSLFNNFLYRDPTSEEHDAGITMVDGFVAVVFYETGNSKEQFVEIFLNSDDYFEGQVRELYFKYLFREPTSEEQSYHAIRYRDSGNYDRLQKDILSLDEFAGL